MGTHLWNINSKLEYQAALERLKELFNLDACSLDSKEANSLMTAIDCYEKKGVCKKSTSSSTEHPTLNC